MSNNKEPFETPFKEADDRALSRRNMLLGTSTLVAAATLLDQPRPKSASNRHG